MKKKEAVHGDFRWSVILNELIEASFS